MSMPNHASCAHTKRGIKARDKADGLVATRSSRIAQTLGARVVHCRLHSSAAPFLSVLMPLITPFTKPGRRPLKCSAIFCSVSVQSVIYRSIISSVCHAVEAGHAINVHRRWPSLSSLHPYAVGISSGWASSTKFSRVSAGPLARTVLRMGLPVASVHYSDLGIFRVIAR